MGVQPRAGTKETNPFYFQTVVVGVGNAVLSGDGAGVHAARALMRDKRLLPGIAVIDDGPLGLSLLGRIADARRILFLDEVSCDIAPGTVIRIAGQDVLDMASERSVHHGGIADLIAALALVSSRNTEVVVLGIRPSSVRRKPPLSATVKPAVAPLVDAALDQLRAWQPVARAVAGQ